MKRLLLLLPLALLLCGASPNTTQVPSTLWTVQCANGLVVEATGLGLPITCGPAVSNIPLLNGTNTFSAANNFTGGLQLNGNAINANSGAIAPTAIRAGDVPIFNSITWITLPGNNTGTQFLCEDSGGNPGWCTASGSGTVTSITCDSSLTCTVSNPITSKGTVALSTARKTLPTHQVFSTGGASGTYTTPANVLWLEIELVGGGAGGGGAGSGAGAGGNGGNTCWNTTGAACTTPVYQAGGGTGGTANGSGAAAGGTISGSGTCDWSAVGGVGGSASQSISGSINGVGGVGGSSSKGGSSAPGSGGKGGTMGSSASQSGGGGGGAGGTCHVIITSPAATYTYAIGAAGTLGSVGTGGNASSAGNAGLIIVYEHYGS